MRKFNFITIFIVFSFYFFAYASPNSNVNALAYTYMEKNQVPGMSIAIINNGKMSFLNYGYANELEKTRTTDKTIYRVASFSKTYTATLAAIAAVEGKIDLNAPFSQYFSKIQNPRLDSITVSMLLGHVSSFPFNFSPNPNTYSELLKDINQFSPPYPPGSRYTYSNAGIGTVGYIIENVYSENYDKILADEISKPLTLNSTYLNLPVDKEKYIALGHDDNLIRPYDPSNDVWFAASSLKSNIVDMGKFLNAQMNNSAIQSTNFSKAMLIIHQNKYCFANKVACSQLAWQAHVISELNNDHDDTFYTRHQDGDLTFDSKKIINNADFSKQVDFIDKTCAGYGMSGYMAYIPSKNLGIVILLNKSFQDKAVANERIKLGRDILKTLINDKESQ